VLTQLLYRDVVHGDLSAYNVLVWDGEVYLIDFPQAVDPKKNGHAAAFLERDVRRVGEWFERHGLMLPWEEIASDLWTAWTFADLVPEELRGLAAEPS
jgi:RIO kinase 1